MKTTVIAMFCLFLAGKTFSQEYYPLVVEDNLWNVMVAGIGPNFDTVFTTVSYKLYGDSVINSLTYKKMYQSWEEIPENWSLYGFMREDADKKAWLRTEFISQELLLYDFSVVAGDTVTVGQDPVSLVVDSITIVSVNGTERQKFWLSFPENPYYFETWITGIGSDKGIVWSGSALLVGGFYELLCMSNSGEQIYMNPKYDFCYINTVGVDEEIAGSFQIYPIPVNDYLKINNLNNVDVTSIIILDYSGRKLKDVTPDSEMIDLSGLTSGIYFLKIASEDGEVVKKILKK